MKWMIRLLLGFFVLLVAAINTIGWTYPALAAAVCAPCAGMERVAPDLVVEPDMPVDARTRIVENRSAAKAKVAAYFKGSSGALDRAVLVACRTETCDRRMGGRGARATTLTTPLLTAIRLSPRGLDRTIITHELAHVEFHARIGQAAQMSGAVPAWFDEGLAVIISKDERYVRNGKPVDCGSGAALPASPFEWAPASGRDPVIYAHAACRVLSWLEANGGRAGLLDALAKGRSLP